LDSLWRWAAGGFATCGLRLNKRLNIGWDNNDHPASGDEPYWLAGGALLAIGGVVILVVASL
jgi:hypothetical protein